MSEAQSSPPYTPDQTYNFSSTKRLELYPAKESVIGTYDAALEALERVDEEYLTDPVAHFAAVAEGIRQPIKDGAPPYAIYKDADCSEDTALIIALPYANPIKPESTPEQTAEALSNKNTKAFDSNSWNQAEKHYFLFRVMQELGIRDGAGKTIPVIAVASPSVDWQPSFDKEAQQHLKRGDFGPLAFHLQDILDYEGFGKAHVGGYSMGAAVAHFAVANFIT